MKREIVVPNPFCLQNDQEKGFITFETFPQRIPFDWPKTKFIKKYLTSCL
jgi:hypothetical protein